MVLNTALALSPSIDKYTNLKTVCLKLQIINETIIDVVSTKKLLPHQQYGLDMLKTPFVDPQQSAFYIVSESGKLLLILWQPASIRERVLYAASSSLLKDKFPLVYREFHASNEEELESIKQAVRQGLAANHTSADRRMAMSVAEIEKEEQETERQELTKKLEGHLKVSLTRPDQHEDACEHGGVFKQTIAALTGGFHPINMKLTEPAKSSLRSMIASETVHQTFIKYLELCVLPDGQQIDSVVTRTLPVTDEQMLMPSNPDEPRFYYLLLEQSGNLIRVFTYLCPPKANPRVKMIYSSAKAGLLKDLQKLSSGGSAFDYRMDYFEETPLTLKQLLCEYNENAVSGRRLTFNFAKPIRRSRPPSRVLNTFRLSGSSLSTNQTMLSPLSPTSETEHPQSDKLQAAVNEEKEGEGEEEQEDAEKNQTESAVAVEREQGCEEDAGDEQEVLAADKPAVDLGENGEKQVGHNIANQLVMREEESLAGNQQQTNQSGNEGFTDVVMESATNDVQLRPQRIVDSAYYDDSARCSFVTAPLASDCESEDSTPANMLETIEE